MLSSPLAMVEEWDGGGESPNPLTLYRQSRACLRRFPAPALNCAHLQFYEITCSVALFPLFCYSVSCSKKK